MKESITTVLVAAVLVLAGCDRGRNAETPSPSNDRKHGGVAQSRPVMDRSKETEQPAAPGGYSWYSVPNVGVSILKPDGWHTHKPMVSKAVIVLKISRETPEKGFHTGLTVNIVCDVEKKSNVKPTLYATHFIEQKRNAGRVIETFDLVELERGMKRCGVTLEQEMTVMGVTQQYTVHHTLFANDATGTLYVLTFGTPSPKWEADQRIWNTMRQVKLNIDL